jgi:hypothetical protein
MSIRMSPLAALAVSALAMLPTGGMAMAALDATTQSHLGFGQLIATPAPGAVTVSPAGARTPSGGVVLGNGFGVSAAAFAVTGDPNLAFSITLPSSATLDGAGSSLTADSFTSTPSGAGNLGPSGAQSVTVGATLHVGSSQSATSYSGSFAVTFAYN